MANPWFSQSENRVVALTGCVGERGVDEEATTETQPDERLPPSRATVRTDSSLHWSDVAAGDDNIVEPNGLAVLPVLFRRVAFVVAVMFKP